MNKDVYITLQKDNLITHDIITVNQRSCIDVLTSCSNMVTDFDVLDLNLNFSDHCPVAVTCYTKLPSERSNSRQRDNVSVTPAARLCWVVPISRRTISTRDVVKSRCLTKPTYITAHLNVSDSIDYAQAANVLHADTVDVPVSAANAYVRKHRKNFYKNWSDEELNLFLKDDSIDSNELRKAEGKPRHGLMFDWSQACRLQ